MNHDRVRSNTPSSIQEEIDRRIETETKRYAQAEDAIILQKIDDLDRKWDIERTLEFNASIFALTGAILAVTINLYWLILTGVVLFFLGQHAIQGWCPPLPLFRKMGIRTRKEMDAEKYTLLAVLRNRKRAVQ